jgi:prepilin-type N-terminal cleavage/methylation domain-containing protein
MMIPTPQKGFTLIEVIFSAAILVMAVTALSWFFVGFAEISSRTHRQNAFRDVLLNEAEHLRNRPATQLVSTESEIPFLKETWILERRVSDSLFVEDLIINESLSARERRFMMSRPLEIQLILWTDSKKSAELGRLVLIHEGGRP